MATATRPVESDELSDILVPAFVTSLRARNRSDATITSYRAAVRLLSDYLAAQGMPRTIEGIRREHLEMFEADLQAKGAKPATVANRHRSLQQFFKWAVENDEIAVSPMAKMSVPFVPEQRVEALSDDEVRRLLKACEGSGFEDRRDMAIVRLMLDSGARRAEVAGIRVEDIDWQTRTIAIVGKGARPGILHFGTRTSLALNKYRRLRDARKDAKMAAFWLGKRGPMTPDGIAHVIESRGRMAGLTIHPHQTRHTWAHVMKSGGATDEELMRLGRWRSMQMVARYGASMADVRAGDAHRRIAPGDRF